MYQAGKPLKNKLICKPFPKIKKLKTLDRQKENTKTIDLSPRKTMADVKKSLEKLIE